MLIDAALNTIFCQRFQCIHERISYTRIRHETIKSDFFEFVKLRQYNFVKYEHGHKNVFVTYTPRTYPNIHAPSIHS